MTKIISQARNEGGTQAVEHLQEIITNNAFLHTSICPDERAACKAAAKNTDTERIFQLSPCSEKIIGVRM